MSARVDEDPWNQPDPDPLQEQEPYPSEPQTPYQESDSIPQPSSTSHTTTEIEPWSQPDPVSDENDTSDQTAQAPTPSSVEVERELGQVDVSDPSSLKKQNQNHSTTTFSPQQNHDSTMESSQDGDETQLPHAQAVVSSNPKTESTGDKKSNHNDQDEEEEDDDDEPFIYTSSNKEQSHSNKESDDSNNHFSVSPTLQVTESSNLTSDPSVQPQPQSQPSLPPIPIDHSRLSTLCSQGPLSQLEELFSNLTCPSEVWSPISNFALANEPNPHSGLGLTPLHYAAKNGKVEICKWLVERGAMVGLEDGEGETALHKAALAGKLPTLTFLLSSGASATCKDSDGWTPLHNACSRGYLDIAKVLIERFDADVSARGGRGGWTPLMNAASNGHLTLVRYLTNKCQVDPFLRNQSGETAYDVAASTFEIFSCQVLEKYENEKWNSLKLSNNTSSITSSADGENSSLSNDNGNAVDGSKIIPGKGPYNPLALHTTVPILLYENQRLDTRLGTLASHGGKPRWSGTHSARRNKSDRRAPSTMPPGPLAQSRSFNTHIDRNDVGLPSRLEPYRLSLPKRGSKARKAKLEAKRRREGGLKREDELLQDQDELGSTPTTESVLRDRVNSTSSSSSSSGRGGENITITNSLSGEKSHFWLSDWRIDLTHPLVDPSSGWQYAQTFNAPDEKWIGSIPPPLNRLLEGKGLGASLSRAITGGVLPGPGASNGQSLMELASGSASPSHVNGGGSRENEIEKTGWVRRRRWIRVMRRRLDIEFGDDLELAEFGWAENLGKSNDPYDEDSEDDSINGTSSGTGGGLFSSTRKSANNSTSKAVNEARLEAKNQVRSLGNSADYIERAITLAGKGSEMGSTPADILTRSGEDGGKGGIGIEVAKKMARLDLAVQELRSNAFDDTDADRRSKAEDLLKEYTLQLGQLKQSTGLEEASDEEESDEDDDDEEFIYPNSFKDDGISVITKMGPSGSSLLPSSLRPNLGSRTPSTPSVFGGVAPSEAGTTAGNIRSQDLAGSREFRVPTNEAPNTNNSAFLGRNGQSVYSTADSSTSNVFGTGISGNGAGQNNNNSRPILREHNLQAQWERDESVGECRGCSRKFTFFLRKHHCRRCGRIFCDPCSSRRAKLTSNELVIDPALPEMLLNESNGVSRICNSCDAERNLPLNLRIPRGYDSLLTHANVSGIHANDSNRIDVDGNGRENNGTSDVSSRASELNECPVCTKTLAEFGSSLDQEEHVRNCLENGGGGSVQGGRYLVYKLPETSPIVGKECSICMEEFVSGSLIARLPCLCYFDRACIDSWLRRGRHCPVHAREV